jgi:hypothetical protein
MSPELHRLRVVQYERLADLGVFDDLRLELIDGLLVTKMPKQAVRITTAFSPSR